MTRKQAARIRAGIVAANEYRYAPKGDHLTDEAWFRRMDQLIEQQERARVRAYRRRSAPYSE